MMRIISLIKAYSLAIVQTKFQKTKNRLMIIDLNFKCAGTQARVGPPNQA